MSLIATLDPATQPATQTALDAALEVSGVALIAIFVVMGLFALLITLLGRFFAEKSDNTTQGD